MTVDRANHRLATSTGSGLSRRQLMIAALATPAFVTWLASCGDGTQATEPTSSTEPAPTTELPATTVTPAPAFVHPTGPDDVVIRLAYVGGFVPVGYAFTSVPNLLVSGDGRLITPGAIAEIYPGPLLPTLLERPITEAGIQNLLALADDAGLLAPPPDYSGEIMVADAPDTLVVIEANDETFTHQAPALGFEEPNESDVRKALSKFVDGLADIEAAAGAENLGESVPLVAQSYRIQARLVSEADLAGYDPAPNLVAWPTDIGTTLADAADCVIIPAERAGSLFTDATQTTFFTEPSAAGSVDPSTSSSVGSAAEPRPVVLSVYQVSAVAFLPGDLC